MGLDVKDLLDVKMRLYETLRQESLQSMAQQCDSRLGDRCDRHALLRGCICGYGTSPEYRARLFHLRRNPALRFAVDRRDVAR